MPSAPTKNTVKGYPSIGLVTVLYVESNVSLCLLHLVEQMTLGIGIVSDALAVVLSMCLL